MSLSNRVNFATSADIPNYPDFLDIQVKSFKDFFQLETKSNERSDEGLYKTFLENFPISDARNQFVLEFLDYFVDPPRYSTQECIERGLTYSVPLKARLKLYCTDPEHEDFETIVQDVYLGVIPYMTSSGTFIINGAERVVVSQLHRSPGVFFGQSFHANGTKLYSARVIPFKGSWIEFSSDINGVMYAYIDRKKKLPVTTLLRTIGYERDKDILEIFDLAEEVKVFTFTKEEFEKLKVRKIKKYTKYSLGSNENGNFLRAEAEGQASGLGKEISIDLNKTPFLNITWKIEKNLSGINEKSKKGHDYAARVFVIKKTGSTALSNRAINYVFSSNEQIGEHWRSPFTKKSIDYVLSTTNENNNEWVTVKTNVKKDFKKLHDLEVEELNGVAIMSDTDNSKRKSIAYYQNIYFSSD